MNPSQIADPLTVLALQGGGALGAYQAGVYQGLAEHAIQVSWVVGTSIGAINGAIIAGNPPERRVERLRAFWDSIARDGSPPLSFSSVAAWLGPWASSAGLMEIFIAGVPGFFVPRSNMVWDPNYKVRPREASFYDTSPLADTLRRFVDFAYLNKAHVRYTIGAVKVAGGDLHLFDSAKQEITVRHVMASGALPPGFPPIEVDGVDYWDGGVYSNTPIDVVLDEDERRDLLCFSVDLWEPDTKLPQSIAEVLTQEKNIRYASRSREHLKDHERMQNLRRAVRLLSERLGAKERASHDVQRLAELGCGNRINIVRLIMKELPADGFLKDVDFRRSTLEGRWAAGYEDAQRACRHKSWLQPLAPETGLAVHELAQG